MDNARTYPGASWEEEQKARAWEALPQGEKDRQIEEARLSRLHWGRCQRCDSRIEATGATWPSICPSCGYGGPDGDR